MLFKLSHLILIDVFFQNTFTLWHYFNTFSSFRFILASLLLQKNSSHYIEIKWKPAEVRSVCDLNKIHNLICIGVCVCVHVTNKHPDSSKQ